MGSALFMDSFWRNHSNNNISEQKVTQQATVYTISRSSPPPTLCTFNPCSDVDDDNIIIWTLKANVVHSFLFIVT